MTAEERDARSEVLEDPGRLAALRRAGAADGEPSDVLEWLTSLTTRLLRAPVALVTLVDRDRQIFRSSRGLEPGVTETPLSHSFCQYVVADRGPFVVPDAHDDPLVAGNLAIESLGVVAYAGVPLIDRDGHALGSFCAIDHAPREWRPEDVEMLAGFATVAVADLERRSALAELEDRERHLRSERGLSRLLASGLGAAALVTAADGVVMRVIGDPESAWGVPARELTGRPAWEALPQVPGAEPFAALGRGERASGVKGGGWSILPMYDEQGTPSQFVVLRPAGDTPAGAVPQPGRSAAPAASAALVRWVGLQLDDAAGFPVGRVEGVLASRDEPPWLLVRLPGGRHVACPAAGCVGAGTRVAAPRTLEEIAASPALEPGRPGGETVASIAAHYGVARPVGPLELAR